MEFQTLYKHFQYPGETNDGTLHVVPNEAMSPKEILRRFVRDVPVAQTSKPLEIANDNLDNDPFPMQGQEFDKLEEMDKLMQNETTNLDS